MHTLICGVTESGKTTAAHVLAEMDNEKKTPLIVYDPVLTETAAGEWPRNSALFDDGNKFLSYMERTRKPCAVYVDEAADLFDQAQRENRWILTRGRHYGFSVTVICQRPKMVSPSVRNQCARLLMFRLANDDRQVIGADYGHSDFNKISLDRGDFVLAYSGDAAYTRHNIFDLLTRGKRSCTSTLKLP